MEVEFVIINNDDAIAIVYKHETLGRVVVVNGKIDPRYNLEIYSLNTGLVENKDMTEFLLKSLPIEGK